MKKYIYSVLIMALFAIGFAASDESDSSNVDNQEQTREQTQEQTREKTEEEIIGDLAYKEGADFAREDRGEFYNNFIRAGLTSEGAEGQFKVYVRGVYRSNHPDASDELVQIYAEKYLKGYLSVLK